MRKGHIFPQNYMYIKVESPADINLANIIAWAYGFFNLKKDRKKHSKFLFD